MWAWRERSQWYAYKLRKTKDCQQTTREHGRKSRTDPSLGPQKRTWQCQYLDPQLLDSRTMRQQLPLFKPLSLQHFVTAALATSRTPMRIRKSYLFRNCTCIHIDGTGISNTVLPKDAHFLEIGLKLIDSHHEISKYFPIRKRKKNRILEYP